MWKRILQIMVALAIVIVIVAALGGTKMLQFKSMGAAGKKRSFPPAPVTTAMVKADQWETTYAAVGTLGAVQGVTVTAEVRGKIMEIAFTPGTRISSGDLIARQDTSVEKAQLRAAEATLALAKATYDRAARLLPQKVIPQSDYDNADARLKEAVAQVDRIRTVIDQKTIRAPFSGRLGIRQVNLGQNLNEGDPIVTLQDLDPIFVNFHLPQQALADIQKGLTVRVKNDILNGDPVKGTLTAISPEVDSATRNATLQATVSNSEERLLPGMFVQVEVVLPDPDPVLMIPATAVLHAPYSDSVFLVVPAEKGRGHVLRQQIIELGRSRGDFVAVGKGLTDGDTVVSTGVFKLRNGQPVVVDNKLNPDFALSPKPKNG